MTGFWAVWLPFLTAGGKVFNFMTEIIGVRFKNTGKTYYFSPAGERIPMGEKVIVETARGVECGSVVIPNRQVDDAHIVAPLKPIIRRATKKDLAQLEENLRKEKEAFQICQEKIAKHKLQMNLVDVEYTFDNNKVLFYFTADGRIDFRELVKDLAGVFRTRIELRTPMNPSSRSPPVWAAPSRPPTGKAPLWTQTS